MGTLIMRFAGPLQGYGTHCAMEAVRDTASEPTKAAAIGVICAAIGKDRDSDGADGLPTLASLSSLKMGVRVDAEGALIGDFQVAGAKRRVPIADGGFRSVFKPPCFIKMYLSGASFLVGMEGPDDLLAAASEALKSPRWAPCLGRRGCVPTTRIRLPDGGLRTMALVDALRSESPRPAGSLRFVVEVLPGEGTRVVADVPLDFSSKNRRFGAREVKDWVESV